MEGNKDESNKCLLIASRLIEQGSYEKAEKYLNKAERLYPSQRAKDLLERIKTLNTGDTEGGDENTNSNKDEGIRKRKGSFGRRKKSDANSDSEVKEKEKEYTEEQLSAVRRIKQCKDYYEILGVEKDCSENDLKKGYRKLALQMHPDKNKAPGSTEAFKAVGNAFGVLNDPAKRKKYDVFGPEEEQRARQSSREYDYSHGFEGDISPEELFNMFFGGNFPSGSVYTRRNRQAHSHRQHFRYSRESQSNEGGATLLLQLAPILLLVFLSLISSFFVSDPVYNLQRTDRYPAQRKTSNLKVPYFVKSDFTSNFAGDLRRIERQVEDEYVSNLRSNCWRERSYKENMLWKARNYADAKLYERAQDMETPSCEQLQRLYG